jgi:hypothetical protein
MIFKTEIIDKFSFKKPSCRAWAQRPISLIKGGGGGVTSTLSEVAKFDVSRECSVRANFCDWSI